MWRVLWKELRVALICGVILSAVNFVRMLIFVRAGVMVAVTVSLSMFCTVVIAKPWVPAPQGEKKLGLDPAIMFA